MIWLLSVLIQMTRVMVMQIVLLFYWVFSEAPELELFEEEAVDQENGNEEEILNTIDDKELTENNEDKKYSNGEETQIDDVEIINEIANNEEELDNIDMVWKI